MSISATFDTLDFVNDLKKGGIKQEEAEAITHATQKAIVQIFEIKNVATKNDLIKLQLELQKFIFKSTGLLAALIAVIGAAQTLVHFFPVK